MATVPEPSTAIVVKPSGGGGPPVRLPTTTAMRVVLTGAVLVFGVVVMWKILLALNFLFGCLLLVGAGEVLAHTGGLDKQPFAACLYVALALPPALVVGLFVRQRVLAASGSATQVAKFGPVSTAAVSLLVALVLVTLVGWFPSRYFPDPVATVVVLANLIFFAALGLNRSTTLTLGFLGYLRTLGGRSQYLAGALTTALLLVTGGSAALLVGGGASAEMVALGAFGDGDRLGADVRAQLRDRLGLDEIEAPQGFEAKSRAALCVAANAVAPARAQAASGCDMLPPSTTGGAAWGRGSGGGNPPDGECLERLAKGHLPLVRGLLESKYRLSPYDADDIAVSAMVATCAQDPRSPGAYFVKTARNAATHYVRQNRRFVSCEYVDLNPPARCVDEPDDLSDEEVLARWQRVRCAVAPRTWEVIRLHAVEGLRFAAIGLRLGMTENEARYTYNNARRRLQKMFPDCIR